MVNVNTEILPLTKSIYAVDVKEKPSMWTFIICYALINQLHVLHHEFGCIKVYIYMCTKIISRRFFNH
jgi:hypothetical protein